MLFFEKVRLPFFVGAAIQCITAQNFTRQNYEGNFQQFCGILPLFRFFTHKIKKFAIFFQLYLLILCPICYIVVTGDVLE